MRMAFFGEKKQLSFPRRRESHLSHQRNGIPAYAGMTLVLMVLFASVILPKLSFAASSCYNPDQVAAEHLLRFHSELMVITVTCRQSSQGADLVSAYTNFTKQNIERIKQAETTLKDYYTTKNGGDGISQLDQLRTRLGNEFGQEVANQSAPAFCAQRRDKVITMMGAPRSSIDQELLRFASHRTYVTPCSAPETRTVQAK